MVKLVYFSLLLASAATVALALGYDGYKIYEVVSATQEQSDLLHELSMNEDKYDFFSLSRLPNQAAHVMVPPDVAGGFVRLLQANHFSYKLVNPDAGQSVRQEIRTNKLLRTLLPYHGDGRLSTERYYTHDEINAYISDLAARFPSRVFVKTVGKSYEGRILKTITITNGDARRSKNVILMDGGFHAREWISPAAVLYVIEQLVEHFEENAELLLDYDWIILPVVNPDGYEHTQLSTTTRFWRKTRTPIDIGSTVCYGTDPNRNFDFHWNEAGTSTNPCSDIFSGSKAFSEPETRVVRDIMYSLRHRGKMYLTVHSYGNLVLYPWGYAAEVPDTWEELLEVGEAFAHAVYNATQTTYTVGSSTVVLYAAAGASDDFAFHIGFPLSYTLELPRGGEGGFDPPPSRIDPIVKETWIGIRAMAHKCMQKYPLN